MTVVPLPELPPLDPRLSRPGCEEVTADGVWLFLWDNETTGAIPGWSVQHRPSGRWMLWAARELDNARALVADGEVMAYLVERDGPAPGLQAAA